MPTTSGKILKTEPLPRACGHVKDFVTYEVDPFNARRREKHLTKRCPARGQVKSAEDARRQQEEVEARQAKEAASLAAKVTKRLHAVKQLPEGTTVGLVLGPGGKWLGTLLADGMRVETQSEGSRGIVAELAAKWLEARLG